MRPVGDTTSGAAFSDDGLYRYSLYRKWDRGDSMVFIMLNPSTADHTVDDPTIRRCIGFAKREGLAGIEVINLYALRATRPPHLLDHPDPEGPENEHVWEITLRYFDRGPIVAAWGASAPDGVAPSAAFSQADIEGWLCLGHTQGGQPTPPALSARHRRPGAPVTFDQPHLGTLGTPTLEEATALGEEAMKAAWDAADDAWITATASAIARMHPGTTFIAEDVVLWATDHGYTTRNAKAIGPVISRAARAGLIIKTGDARPARTSHGSLKPEWKRTL